MTLDVAISMIDQYCLVGTLKNAANDGVRGKEKERDTEREKESEVMPKAISDRLVPEGKGIVTVTVSGF